MPNLSASDYTSFIKAQAASQAYRNGAIPNKIQTSDQPFATQSVLNAQLLTSQAAHQTISRVATDVIGTTVSAASATTLTGASGDGTTITYISSVAHGLTAGMVVTISGFTGDSVNFNLSNQTVIASGLTSTQFRVTNEATGTATNNSTTGRIDGFVYYTTAAAHGFTTNTQNLSISGIATEAFNLSLVNVAKVPSSTVFAIATTATGTARTSQSGFLTLTRYPNPNNTITGIARVRPYDGYGNVNNPKSLVTLTQSGTLSSGKTQQLGGLPTTAPKGSGVYAPTPQLARVDTKATGAYKAVRAPV